MCFGRHTAGVSAAVVVPASVAPLSAEVVVFAMVMLGFGATGGGDGFAASLRKILKVLSSLLRN